MAVKWSLFYANWYQPPWTDPKICPHSRTLRKFGKNHISPHGQTPLKFGKPHESLVTRELINVKRLTLHRVFLPLSLKSATVERPCRSSRKILVPSLPFYQMLTLPQRIHTSKQ